MPKELRVMFVRTLGTAVFAVGFAASAWADGMPEYSRVYAPAFSWTGFYIGANVGWERKRMVGSDYDLINSPQNLNPRFGDDTGLFFRDLITDGVSTAAPFKQDISGAIYGGQI